MLKKSKEESEKTIKHKLRFCDSFLFLLTSFEYLLDYLSDHIREKKYQKCECLINYVKAEEASVIYFIINVKNTQDLNLIIFANTFEFCDIDFNKYSLLVRKEVYLHEYMDSWSNFHETTLAMKESFYP